MRPDFLTFMLFYFYEKSNPKANRLTADSASTVVNRNGLVKIKK